MLDRWRCAATIAAVTVVAGCGGSTKTTTVNAPSRPPPRAAHLTPSAISLPLSFKGPTTCTIYERGFATQVIFSSERLNVRLACKKWVGNQAGGGYLWGYEPASATADVGTQRICRLIDPRLDVAVSVVQDSAFVPLSAAERAGATAACATIAAAGWVPQDRNRRR